MSMDPLELAKKKTQLLNTVKKAESAKTALKSTGNLGTELQRNTNISDLANKQLQNLNVGGVSAVDVTDVKKLKELPIQADPELLKKEAMAKAQTLRADAEQMLQQKKEEEINKLKDRAENLIPPQLIAAAGLFLVLPITDPKFLATIAYQKAKTKIKELKQKASKENLKKSKEAFTFPMKPPTKLELGELPKIPEVPKIPEIPKLNVPRLPEIPRINLPNNPLG